MMLNLLDVNYYQAVNPDLAQLSPVEAISHFNRYGLEEKRQFSPFVNLNFYRASNPDLANFSDHQAYEHLKTFGVSEGRLFSPHVDLEFYKSQNGDLQGFDNEQLFEHLRNFGVGERRNFSPFFSTNLYLAANPDVNAFYQGRGLQALEHFLQYGIHEGRQFSNVFDANYYRATHPDFIPFNFNNLQLLEHFVNYGLNEGRASSESFSIQYYLNSNSDLKALNFNFHQAIKHFSVYGLSEGRLSNSPIVSDYAGNSLSNARPIAIDNNSAIFSDSIGFRDSIDLYRFDLSTIRGSSLNVRLSGQLTNSIQLELLDANGAVLQSSNNGGNTWQLNNTIDAFRKGAGTYYIQIKVDNSFSTTTNYSLSISTSSLTTGNSSVDHFIDLTNTTRSDAGRSPLLLNTKLVNAAQTHSQDMAINDFFELDDDWLKTRASSVNYDYMLIGGIISAGQDSPNKVIQEVLKKSNLTNRLLDRRVQEIGAGFFYLENDPGTDRYNYYWTQILGQPRSLDNN